MMTSRSEYRLVLRQDNAEERLTPLGYKIGLISKSRFDEFCKKDKLKYDEIEYLNNTIINPSNTTNGYLVAHNTSAINNGVKAAEILKRPQICYKDLAHLGIKTNITNPEMIEKIETEIKYEGYIKKQLTKIEQMKKLENKNLPTNIDYKNIAGLRLEAREKLNKIKPTNLGQASRISGVSPADISILLIWLFKN